MARIRVPAGFLLAGLYFYYSQPTWKTLVPGAFLAFLGLLIRAWATGHIQKDLQLAFSGPYAHTRNPLYFGSFLIGVGFSIAGNSILILLVFLICFTLVYGTVIHHEMNKLRDLFPKEYARYEKSVPLFFPKSWPGTQGKERFRFERYLKNREYRALAGYLTAIGLLILKI